MKNKKVIGKGRSSKSDDENKRHHVIIEYSDAKMLN